MTAGFNLPNENVTIYTGGWGLGVLLIMFWIISNAMKDSDALVKILISQANLRQLNYVRYHLQHPRIIIGLLIVKLSIAYQCNVHYVRPILSCHILFSPQHNVICLVALDTHTHLPHQH